MALLFTFVVLQGCSTIDSDAQRGIASDSENFQGTHWHPYLKRTKKGVKHRDAERNDY